MVSELCCCELYGFIIGLNIWQGESSFFVLTRKIFSALNFFHGGKTLHVSFLMYLPMMSYLGERRELSHLNIKICADLHFYLTLFSAHFWFFLATPCFLFCIFLFRIWNLKYLVISGVVKRCEDFRLKVHLVWRERKAWANR